MPRVAIGGLWHETNTFASGRTPLQAFTLVEGEEIRATLGGTRTPLGGFLDAVGQHGLEAAPAFFAWALPSGTVERAACELMTDRLVDTVGGLRPDAVLLDLHGAMVAEGTDDVEGELLRRLRARLGTIPLGVVFDLHANVSRRFVELVDLFAGYDTYPHVDPYERGLEVASLLARFVRGQIRPARAYAQPPLLLVPQAQATDVGSMRALMERAHEWERVDGALTVTVSGGFPYADVPFAGLSVTATTDGEAALASEIARDIAWAAWKARDAFRVSNLSPEEAVAQALRAPGGPVILVDVGDNIGGGAAGDGTVLLRALLKARARGAVVSVTDPEVVDAARRAGEGATIAADVGGKSGDGHGDPVPVRARVARMGKAGFVYSGSYMTGRRVDAGWAAVLDADGVNVVVRERKVMPFDRGELESVGLTPEQCRIIVVKSAIAWRAAYGEIARRVIEVDTPGPCTADLQRLTFRRLRRPVVPLDGHVAWDER